MRFPKYIRLDMTLNEGSNSDAYIPIMTIEYYEVYTSLLTNLTTA
jgi:hypothetical protein